MNRKSVISSDLRSVGYDEEKQMLEIEFHDGRIYCYSKVPPIIHEKLMKANSHGTYFSHEIRNHPERYPYLQLK